MPHHKEQQLREAIAAVNRGQLSVSKAAREYDVARSTVMDHVRNPNMSTSKAREQLLTREEENGLVEFMIYMARQGFPLTKPMVRAYVLEIVAKSGRITQMNLERGPSDRWFRRLKAKHPDLKFQKPNCQEPARLRMANLPVVQEFLNMWEQTLKTNKVNPEQIFNCDETGWSGKEKFRTRVYGPKDGQIKQQAVMTSEHITAHLCVSASGRFLPPMVIFKGGMPHRTFKDGIPGSWLFASSDSGFMDGDLFIQWLTECFLKHCGPERPVVLLLDNHDSHISLRVVEVARENGVVMVCMPSHTTHILQPLDVKMQSIAMNAGLLKQGLTIGKAHMPVLLAHAIDQTTPSSIKEAFKLSGTFPVDVNALDHTLLVPASFPHDEAPAATPGPASTSPIKTCGTCGQYLGQNPLVKRGLVPESLAEILVPPPVKEKRKQSSRVVPKGRVISGDEMLALLKEKEDLARKKEQEAERRRQEREENREKREHEKEEIRKRKEIRQKKKEDSEEKKKRKKQKTHVAAEIEAEVIASFYVCGVCGVHGTIEDDVYGVMWFGCDEEMCGRWYHELCLCEDERQFVRESLEEGSDWCCKVCKPWLYEE